VAPWSATDGSGARFPPDRPLCAVTRFTELDGMGHVVIVGGACARRPSGGFRHFHAADLHLPPRRLAPLFGQHVVSLYFGDNVEDRFGRIGYLLFYLLRGVAQRARRTFSRSRTPPSRRSAPAARSQGSWARTSTPTRTPKWSLSCDFLLPRDPGPYPAPLFLGFWFLLQFVQGSESVTARRRREGSPGGRTSAGSRWVSWSPCS
jgi:hypothetical protein